MWTSIRGRCLAVSRLVCLCFFFFFFNDTATTEIYTLSLHDALPIYPLALDLATDDVPGAVDLRQLGDRALLILRLSGDRKSTRLNSSHVAISYAVFCLKKKKKKYTTRLDSSHTHHAGSILRS